MLNQVRKMCELVKHGTTRIDPCLVDEIYAIKTKEWIQNYQSIMSCCGHGKYKKTFIVRNRATRHVFDWFTGVDLTKTGRARKKQPYYKKDKEGYYFIPELMKVTL